jgi:hypothetical protein
VLRNFSKKTGAKVPVGGPDPAGARKINRG